MMDEHERATLSIASDAKLARLEIELFEQDLNEMRDYLASGQFENENEGWRYLLATGYAYLRAERDIVLPGGTRIDEEGLDRWLKRSFQIEAMYAVMKQRAYQWMKDHQAMDLSYSSVRIRADALENRVWGLLNENRALKTELAQLREQVARLTPDTSESTDQEPPAPAPALWKRWLKRGR